MSKVFAQAKKFSKLLDSFGVESKGIHRYLPSERYAEDSWSPYVYTFGLWVSGCGGLTSMSSFFLGPLIFGLGYKDTLVLGTTGQLLGCLFAAYCATMGPRSGLRQMCSARYLFGPWMVRVVSLITIIGYLGWSVTNNVLCGEILKWLSGGKLSLSVGIIIVSILSLVVALFGIEYVLKFQGVIGASSIVVVFLMYIIAGNEYTKYEDLPTIAENTMTKVGNRLSFFALTYSVTSTWGGCAADYYIVFPETVSQVFIYIFTFFAIAIPTTFGAVIGMLIGNAAVGNELWNETYEAKSLGGLLYLVFDRWGNFGKFLLVIMWLSANNVINNYSSALSAQLLDDLAYRYLSRWFIVIIITIITLICSLVGKNHFSEILSNFLPMLGYWISIYFTLLLEENTIFRSTRLVKLFKKELYEESSSEKDVEKFLAKDIITLETILKENDINVFDLPAPSISSSSLNLQRNENIPPYSTVTSVPYYNFNAWNDMNVLTHGIAATASFFIGVAGAVLGMNQVYFSGPISRKVGDHGADLGMFLSIVFTAVSYPLLRWLELRHFQR